MIPEIALECKGLMDGNAKSKPNRALLRDIILNTLAHATNYALTLFFYAVGFKPSPAGEGL